MSLLEKELKVELEKIGKQRCETCLCWTAPLDCSSKEAFDKSLDDPHFRCCKKLPMDKYCKEYSNAEEFRNRVLISEIEELEDELSERGNPSPS